MIFSWCLWECDPLCDLWWSQWMFDLRWIPGAAICRGNHDPHRDHDSPDSWLLTRDASHARCPAPTLSSLQACSPLLVSVAQSSWPLARGERGVTCSRHLAPQQMRSWVGPGPLLSAESSQPSYIQCRAEWALGFCSEVQCSIVLCRACRIGHVYFRVG